MLSLTLAKGRCLLSTQKSASLNNRIMGRVREIKQGNAAFDRYAGMVQIEACPQDCPEDDIMGKQNVSKFGANFSVKV
jgi:hypothetical protein